MTVLPALLTMLRTCFSEEQSKAREDMIAWNRTFKPSSHDHNSILQGSIRRSAGLPAPE
jgi:hypothetical protein